MSHEISRYKELYIWQILDGDAQVGMPQGIIALCQQFMDLKKWPAEKKTETNNYLTFLSERARGKILTGARFIRNFVTKHTTYKQDSFLNEEISFDLLKMLDTLNDPAS